jgi:hypothetical protein
VTQLRQEYGDAVASPPLDAMIAELAKRQHGVVTLEQLRALGLNREWVRYRVAAGRLFPIHRGVYAVGHPGLSREGHFMAAVLASGERAALSHLSLAELRKVSRWPPSVIDVVSMSRRRVQGTRVHTARYLDPRDLTRFRGIPVTTVERMLVDLADVLTPHQLAWVIHEAAFRGLFDLAATRETMTRANGRRGLKTLQRAIGLHLSGSAGTRSAKEDAYLATLGEAALEAARVNTKIEVDVHWPRTGTVVEIDGAPHTRPSQRGEDGRRDAALADAGYEVTRIAM